MLLIEFPRYHQLRLHFKQFESIHPFNSLAVASPVPSSITHCRQLSEYIVNVMSAGNLPKIHFYVYIISLTQLYNFQIKMFMAGLREIIFSLREILCHCRLTVCPICLFEPVRWLHVTCVHESRRVWSNFKSIFT